MSPGVLFTIDEKYNVESEKVDDFHDMLLLDNQYFMSQNEIDENPNGFIADGEHIVIAKMRRKKVIEDLEKLGFLPGCERPEYAYYIVYGQPNARDFPESHYYDIEQTFEDMGWEYTGCPHDFDRLKG
ncbi:hypothetical protein MAH1_24240 [Sessilibacter sp. MAH1]